jgi:midasin (ATPase involved in ribosome maturation)
MAYLLSEDPTDPSYYTIFREALEGWVQRSGQALKGFVYHIRPELDNLSTLVTLSTGFSMSVIWEAVHPIVPSSLEQWNSYNQLLALISDFESKVGNQIGTLLSLLC